MFNNSPLGEHWAAFLTVQRLEKVLLVKGSTQRGQLGVKRSCYAQDVGEDLICLQTLEFESVDTEQSKKFLYFFCFTANCQLFSL